MFLYPYQLPNDRSCQSRTDALQHCIEKVTVTDLSGIGHGEHRRSCLGCGYVLPQVREFLVLAILSVPMYRPLFGQSGLCISIRSRSHRLILVSVRLSCPAVLTLQLALQPRLYPITLRWITVPGHRYCTSPPDLPEPDSPPASLCSTSS